jgi:hypothetical protein
MQTRILGGLSAGLIALVFAGCSSSSSSPSTTTTTSTTAPAPAVSGASSPRVLGTQFATAFHSPAKFCTTYAVPSQVSGCTGDLSHGGVSLKDWKVGNVTVQGNQAVITFTGTACQGSQCVSNSDPNAATDPESAVYAGSTFAETFATANDPNSQNNSPFIAAAVQQGGTWYASGF